jgi:hypothetical protein
MAQIGWIDFSKAHHNKVMLVMDMFKEQGVIDELGLGTIRDALSDLLFPGTSTIQTRAKYFLLIPWIIQDIEKKGKLDRFQSELEQSEIHFVKTLKKNSPPKSRVIGETLLNSNPKRKPSSVYWNGLRIYDILRFQGSLSDYIKNQKYYFQKEQKTKSQLADATGNVPGDDKDANHLYQHKLWASVPRPPKDWKENISIELSNDEATFLNESIIRSNSQTLFAFALSNCLEDAKDFSGIDDFLSVPNLPDDLKKIIKVAIDFNSIMQGALIRYNLLIQLNRKNGNSNQLQLVWDKYWAEMQNFNWNDWNTKTLWDYCPYINKPTRIFVEQWIEIVKADLYNQTEADLMLKNRELRLKGLRRARLSDKAIAQKQENNTGISIYQDGSVSYLTYRWNTVKTYLNDIYNGIANNVTAQ